MLTPEAIIQHFKDDSSRIFNQERLKEEVSQAIYALMGYDDTRQALLAERLGCSRANVSKLLCGSHNFTLETLADVFMALGRSAHISLDAQPLSLSSTVDHVSRLQNQEARSNWTRFPDPPHRAAAMPKPQQINPNFLSGQKTEEKLPRDIITKEYGGAA